MTPLPAWMLDTLEAAVNAYLDLDPEIKERLATMADKTVAVELQDLNRGFFMRLEADRVRFAAHLDGAADASVRGSPLSLARLALSRQGHEALLRGDVVLEGDQALAEAVRDLLRAVEVDWEGLLARATGDVVAHAIGQGVRAAHQWGTDSARSTAEDMADYLQYERRWVVSKDELTAFYRDVDTVRADVDRLSARLQWLHTRLKD